MTKNKCHLQMRFIDVLRALGVTAGNSWLLEALVLRSSVTLCPAKFLVQTNREIKQMRKSKICMRYDIVWYNISNTCIYIYIHTHIYIYNIYHTIDFSVSDCLCQLARS